MRYYKSCPYDLKFVTMIEYEVLITKMIMLIFILFIITKYIYEWLMSFYQDRSFGMKFGPVKWDFYLKSVKVNCTSCIINELLQSCLYHLKFGTMIEYEMLITKIIMFIVISCIINEYIYE